MWLLPIDQLILAAGVIGFLTIVVGNALSYADNGQTSKMLLMIYWKLNKHEGTKEQKQIVVSLESSWFGFFNTWVLLTTEYLSLQLILCGLNVQ